MSKRLISPTLLNLIMGGIIIALSCSVLLGWIIHSSPLVQVHPNFAPMQFNTALAFLLSGLALFLFYLSPRISACLGILILLFSFSILTQYIFHQNWGIDTIFIKPYLNTRTFYPGRMAPNTAIAFSLAALMFIFNGFFKERKFFKEANLIIPLMIFILAFVALIGYITNISSAYTWGPFAGMALHTTISFILMIVPSIPAIYKKIRSSLEASNYFLASIVFFSCMTLFLILTQIIMSKAELQLQDKIKSDAEFVSDKMLLLMQEDIEATERFFLRINHKLYRSAEAMHFDARLYIQQMPWIEIMRIQAVDKKVPPFIFRQAGIQEAQEKTMIEACQKNTAAGAQRFDNNILISVSDKKLCLEDKATKNLIVLNFSSIISSFLGKAFSQKYYVELTSDGQILYQNSPNFDTTSPSFSYTNSFVFKNIPLQLTIYKKYFFYSELYGWLIFLFFCFGIFVSTLLAMAIYLWQGGRLIARRLKDSEEILDHIVRSSPGAILIAQKNDTLSFFNDKALKLWGCTREAFALKSIGDLMPERFRKSHAEFRQRYYKNPKFIPLGARDDLCILNNEGKEIPVEMELNPMKIKGDIQILCTFMDVSQRKQNEAQLKKYTEDLKRSNEALDDFAYIASHDLKEPLRGISNFSEFLMEDYGDKLDQEGKEKLQVLQKLSKRMGTLIDTLLLYSRVGSLDLQLKPLAIRDTIYEKLDLLSTFLREKNVVVNLPESMPTLICDGAKIGEVFQNLITNAVKYNENETKIINISAHEEKEAYIFSVQDNGIGIAEENFEKIFKIFRRLHARDEYGGGTGAGMTIIKKIIERHEGKIWLKSKEGFGTTFFFSISKHLNPHENETTGAQ